MYLARSDGMFVTEKNNSELVEMFNKSGQNYIEFKKSLVNWNMDKKDFVYEFDSYQKLVKVPINEAIKKWKNVGKNQNIWDPVLSFGALTEDRKIFSELEYVDLIERTLPSFLKSEKLDIKNLTLQVQFHGDSDNTHAHIIFFEKRPLFINTKTQKIQFRPRGKFDYKNIQRMNYKIKMLMLNKNRDDIYQIKKDIWDKRKEINKSLREKYVAPKIIFVQNNTPEKKNWIAIINKEILENKSWVYSRLSPQAKEAVGNIVDEMLEKNPYLKQIYQSYQVNIQAFREMANQSNIPEDKRQFERFAQEEQDTLEKQMGNIVTKTIHDVINQNHYSSLFKDDISEKQHKKVLSELFWNFMKIPVAKPLNSDFRAFRRGTIFKW